ncbi:MAG: DUF4386 domain-containing protein [bacterium]|nr:DUF4386 domain-containing protein [bacterium]
MPDRVTEISQRKAAVVAGIGLLITMAGVALAVSCGALPNLFIEGDAEATADRIVAAGGLFRVGILGWLIVILGDVVRAWALYVFLKPVNTSLALLAVWWMLLHDGVLAVAKICLAVASDLLGGASFFADLAPQQLHSLSMLLLKGHQYGFAIGLFFFSFHLLVLGILVFKSGYIPKILGVLLVVAFVGYLIDSAGIIALPNYPEIVTDILSVPNLIGEVAFVGWLAFKGGKTTPADTDTASRA